MIILGIDPGSLITGFGVIKKQGNKQLYVASGNINLKLYYWPDKLKQLYLAINEIIDKYNPDVAAIEQVFVGKNASSALKLGQARGAAITAILKHNLPIGEYSPRTIKQNVVGYGGAEKEQIKHMVKMLLNLNIDLKTDVADALAVAICHASSLTFN